MSKTFSSTIIYTILTTFLLIENVPAQNAAVMFNVVLKNNPAGSVLFICGNHDSLANWNPGTLALKATNDSLWSRTVILPINTPLEYKFTLGSWDKEPVDINGKPFENYLLTARSDSTVFHHFSNWQKNIQNTVTGVLIHHTDIKCNRLPPRSIHVWLPPGYHENSKKRYPVLYMHDAQNLFDSQTASFGNEWRIDEITDSLIGTKSIQPLIIVGIDNTEWRSTEYSSSDTGKVYQKYVINEVKPFIDQNYRTLPGRQHTAVGGSSLGGLIAFIFAWEHSDVFSKAICMSPAFKIDEYDVVTEVQQYTGPKKRIKVYIDNGGVELEQELQPGIDEMIEALNARNYRKGRDFIFIKDETAEHNESAWSKRLPEALLFLFGK